MSGPSILADATALAGTGSFWPWLVAGGVALAALGTWAVLRLLREMGRTSTALVHAAGDSAVRVAEQLAAAFRASLDLDPRIRIDGVTLAEGVVPARELVMVKQVLTRTHDWSNTRLWSTKRVSLTATFTVRAGFELSRPVEIDVGAGGDSARVRWPAPRLLSIQLEDLQPATEEAGWWNRITPEDRAAVQLEMQHHVEQDAVDSGLLARAEVELRQFLHEQTRPTGSRIQLEFEPPVPRPDPASLPAP